MYINAFYSNVQVWDSLALCDDSIKKDLMHNVLLSGGTSLIPGLGDR